MSGKRERYGHGFAKDGKIFHTYDVNWEGWALDMCSLLDRIETTTDDEKTRTLCQDRFELARRHGLDVEMHGETSGSDQ